MFEINGKTKQIGIIGDPVDHSFSPQMHNFISEIMGNNYVYCAWGVEKNNLDAAICGIRAMGFKGVNVTAPHKIEVMQYLDVVTEQAKVLGSVNTVVNRDGKLYGYNTDAEGFYRSLTEKGITVTGAKILVIGAGGVVKPTVKRLIQSNPESVTIVNRTKEKALKMAEEISAEMGYNVSTDVSGKEFDIVINTTSVGMEKTIDKLPIDDIEQIETMDFINEKCAVVDMIYNPEETRFLREARMRGAKTVNGLGMLIHQGLIAYELFTDSKLDENIADAIKKEVFNR